MSVLTCLAVADRPELWADLGFAVAGGGSRVGGTWIQLGVPGRGVTGWGIEGAGRLAELPGCPPGTAAAPALSDHANGVIALDHVVVTTPNLARTVSAFEAAGMPLRRTRPAGAPGRPLVQAFFKLENTVVEVVGEPDAARPGPAGFYGLAFTVADLEATAARLGDRLRPARDAVQPGRRIATL
ncbi:MAG TPA: VOC family protein, partial [Acidimicrobiales bacterium]|nr:VOC family protein [Acidimicrobiales bacterium]